MKRPGEASWHSIGTGEARQIVTEWREWRGPGNRPLFPSLRSGKVTNRKNRSVTSGFFFSFHKAW